MVGIICLELIIKFLLPLNYLLGISDGALKILCINVNAEIFFETKAL